MTPSPDNRRPAGSRGERLQKVLAAAGVGSRRECEELILQGRVEIDRQVVTELGVRVDTSASEVRLDGEVVRVPRLVYYMLNKPTGVVSTNSDPEGRLRVIDLVRSDYRLFPVGRLDRTSEGLILLTNDGELSNQLTHPRYGVSKTYIVTVAGHPSHEELQVLCRGVRLAEGLAKAESVTVKKRQRHATLLEIVLREGKNREIRRLLARVGHKVLRLRRVAQGPLKLGALPVGESRLLTQQEVDALRKASRPSRRAKKPSNRGKAKPEATAKDGKPAGKQGGKTKSRGKSAPVDAPVWATSLGAILEYDEANAGDSDNAAAGGGRSNQRSSPAANQSGEGRARTNRKRPAAQHKNRGKKRRGKR